MKTPFKNIEQVLRLNRTVVLVVVLSSLVMGIFSIMAVVRMYQKSLAQAFVVNGEGEVIPLSLTEQRDHLEIEALAHVEQFHRWFYGLEAGNYEKNLERALWLGNASVAEAYQQKKTEGVYNRLLQYSLVQEVVQIDTQLDGAGDSLGFRARVVIQINRGKVTDNYELVTTGRLIQVERNFPHNPHGLLITDFYENSLQKLETYESTKE